VTLAAWDNKGLRVAEVQVLNQMLTPEAVARFITLQALRHDLHAPISVLYENVQQQDIRRIALPPSTDEFSQPAKQTGNPAAQEIFT
jgi:hypothetical protein